MPDIAGKLFPNLTTLIVQLLSTGVLLLIFKKFLWKNVMEYFAKRADYIESTINEAKEMNEKASTNLETAEKEAREAASKYREILDQAKDDGQKVKKIGNLLTKMRRSEIIANKGSRTAPEWIIAERIPLD